MRNLVLAAIGCVALAGCGKGEADPRGVARDEVLLQVVATGRADTRPDEARFTAGVQKTAANAAAASTEASAVINRVIASLERLGVKGDDIQTRQISLQRIDYGPERGRFQASNVVEVRMRDMKRAGEAIAATSEAGANVMSGPNLVVSDPENASRSAYAQAYKAARARAEAYAGAAGVKVSRVLTIRDVGEEMTRGYYGDAAMRVESGPPPIAMSASAPEAPPPPPMRAGMTTSQVRVRVDFALTK
ncbi:MAG TPA: SIMPL domain-containing protein [Allosphingosinicella sp.]